MYALFFYTDVFGITAAAAGTMFLIARIWDSFFDLLVGIITDRTHTKWGRYRPYLLWFALPFSVMGVITFFVPDFGNSAKLIYAYITYSLMMIVYSFINVPYASLLGVMSADSQQRNILSSYRMSFAFLGSFITFMLLQPLVDSFTGILQAKDHPDLLPHPADAGISTLPQAWTLAVAIIGILCTVLFLFCFRWTRERLGSLSNANQPSSVKKDLKALFRNTPWWILIATGIAALLFNAIRDGVAIYYFKDYVKHHYKMTLTGWDITTIYFLIGQAANLAGVILAPVLSLKFGKKKTYIGANFLAAVLSVIYFFIPNQIGWIFLFQVLISICAGCVFPLLWSMFADIVDYQELKTNRRISGLIFSSSSMSQKLGWAVGAALSGWLLFVFHYNKAFSEQTQQTILGERLMISLLPACCALAATVIMFFYPLTEKKMEVIAVDLRERRNKKNT